MREEGENRPQPDHQPHHTPEQSALLQQLTIEPVPIHDAAFGDGTQVTFPDHNTHVALYPEGTVFQYAAADSVLTFRVSTQGDVVFTRSPLPHPSPDVAARPSETPIEAVVSVEDSQIQNSDEPRHTSHSVASERQPETPVKQPDTEKQQRLTFSGRVGRTPVFRTSPKGTLIAKFPVAEHNDDGSTTWHTVLAFKDKAEKLQGTLQKGEPVEIVGYLHERETHTKDGKPKTVREIYATVIKKR